MIDQPEISGNDVADEMEKERREQRGRAQLPEVARAMGIAPTDRLSVNDPTMIKIHIQSCIASLRDEDGRCKDRPLSIAVTKLEEAVMWIDEHQRLS